MPSRGSRRTWKKARACGGSCAAILIGQRAGHALRAMHALGVLELILPEFHGIDALVIRDAYHRYTVDEHTFVLIDTLHGLEAEPKKDARKEVEAWRVKFGAILAELQNPGLLYLAAVLHDTGKGRVSENHAAESARLARSVLSRLEMDAYDAGAGHAAHRDAPGDVGCDAAGHLRR